MLRRIFRYCAVLGMAGFIFISNCKSAPAEDDMPTYISQPDELVIYEGEIAYAKDAAEIAAQDLVQVEMPGSWIPKTLVIYENGKRVTDFNYSQVADALQPYPLISDYIRSTRSASIETAAASTAPAVSPQKNIVKWKTEIKGSRKITLEYSLNGIGWSPVYNMNVLSDSKASLLYKAMIINKVLPLKDVKITLASGMADNLILRTRYPYYPQSYYYDSRFPAEVAMIYDILIETKPNEPLSARINANYTYELGKRDLENGTTFIELFDKELKYKKEFIWAIYFGQRVDVNYEMKNTTDQLFPKGLIDVYQDGLYLGSDQILNTLPGWTANVTFCGSNDARADKIINSTYITQRNDKRYHHEVELKVENLTDKEITMKIFDMAYRDAAETEYSVKPAILKSGSTLWEITIPAKGTKSILYDFYSDSSYINPYQLSY